MIGLKFKLRGAKEVIEKLAKVRADFPKRVEAALYQEAQVEAREMKRRTPVDTGNLRASIHVEKPVREGRKVSVTIATGRQAPYAIFVHEDLEAFHTVGQAKFMESVLRESAPYMAARLAKRLHLDKGHSETTTTLPTEEAG